MDDVGLAAGDKLSGVSAASENRQKLDLINVVWPPGVKDDGGF